MSFINYFKPVKTITADEAREMVKGKTPGEICLLDVRLPKEYERGHLPGAVLIPIAELPGRLGELDPGTPTIVYCAIGGRSRAGASILQDAGFAGVYNLKGGFNYWNGLFAPGPPETGAAYFKDADNAGDILLLAWAMEEGTRRFYEKMADISGTKDVKEIYAGLAKVEVNHQRTLSELYHELAGTSPDTSSPFYLKYVPEDEMEQVIEGQMKLGEVVTWARERSVTEVLEFAIGLEARLYDLYMRMKAKYKDPPADAVYSKLAVEEKQHLDLFVDLLEKQLGEGEKSHERLY